MLAMRDQIRLRFTDGSVEVVAASKLQLEARVGPVAAAAIAAALLGYSAGYEQPATMLNRPIMTKDKPPRQVAKVGLVVADMRASTKH